MTIEQGLLVAITIAAILFILLLVYLIYRICALVKAFQRQIDQFGEEPKNLIKNLNETTADINNKLSFFDPMFRAFGNVGEGLEYKSMSVKDRFFWKSFKEKVEREETPKDDKISDVANLLVSGVHLWNKLNKSS